MKAAGWLRIVGLLIPAILPVLASAQALGDLVVTPTRVMLDDRTRSSDIMLLNRSPKAIRYRLNLVDMTMSETGTMTRLPEPPETSAARFLRLAPREITLQPGEAQRIKIAVLTLGLPEGELRSHLSFEPVASEKPVGSTVDLEGLSLNFQLRSVITIPVIVRHGKLGASATIQDATAGQDEHGAFVKFRLSRTGNRSVRGDLTVTFTPAKGPKQTLAQQNSVPVYVPNASRIMVMRLSKDPRTLAPGTLEIVFSEPDRARGSAFAKATVEVPPDKP